MKPVTKRELEWTVIILGAILSAIYLNYAYFIIDHIRF